MIRQCAILFGCLALGELIVFLTGIKLPSSIIGMLLLTLFLKLGWIKLQWVQGLSDFLVANLGFFFVPPGVALMLYFDVIEAQFWPIVIDHLRGAEIHNFVFGERFTKLLWPYHPAPAEQPQNIKVTTTQHHAAFPPFLSCGLPKPFLRRFRRNHNFGKHACFSCRA